MSAEIMFWAGGISEKFAKVNEKVKNLNFSLDIDGVEINSAKPAIEKFNKYFSTNYSTNDLVNYWTMVDLVKKERPDIENPREFATNLWNNDDVMTAARPEPGAWLLSNNLYANGIEPHRITMRPTTVRQATFDWYSRNMQWVNPELIHIQDLAEHDPGYKVRMINELGIDIHFDDSVADAEAIVASSKATVILIPQPWNTNYVDPKPGIITSDLSEYVDIPKMVAIYLSLSQIL